MAGRSRKKDYKGLTPLQREWLETAAADPDGQVFVGFSEAGVSTHPFFGRGLLVRVKRGYYRITEEGRKLLASPPPSA